MQLNGVIIETYRNLSRSSTLVFLALAMAAALVWCTVFAGIVGFTGFLKYTFIVFPLAFVPIAARTVTRNYEEAFNLILGTTPFSKNELLSSQLTFSALLLLIYFVLVAPIAWMIVRLGGIEAGGLSIRFATWGLAIGLISLLTGHIIGQVAKRKDTAANSVAILVGAVWYFTAENVRFLLKLARGQASFDIIYALLHLSPLTWAYSRLGLYADFQMAPVFLDHLGGLFFVLLLPTIIVLAMVHLSHNVDAWRNVTRRNATLVASALILSAVVVSVAAIADYRLTPLGKQYNASQFVGEGFEGTTQIEITMGESWSSSNVLVPHQPNEVAYLLLFENVKVDALELTSLSFQSPHLDLHPRLNLPVREVLHGSTDAAIEIPLQYALNYYPSVDSDGTNARIHANMVVNDQSLQVTSIIVIKGPGLPLKPLVGYGGGAIAILLIASRGVPRRLNAWPA